MTAKNKQRRRTQTELARLAGFKTPWPITGLLYHERGTTQKFADRLASLTGTDIRDWLKGGDPAKRRAAVEKWQKA